MNGTQTHGQLFNAFLAVKSLVVYRNILKDPAVMRFQRILEMSLKEEVPVEVMAEFHDFLGFLVEQKENDPMSVTGNLWQDRILDLILGDENCFSLKCEAKGLEGVDESLKELAVRDLEYLRKLYDFDFNCLTDLIGKKLHLQKMITFPQKYYKKAAEDYPHPENYFVEKQRLKSMLSASADWGKNLGDIARFYKSVGCGSFGRYWGFKWVKTETSGKLEGIPEPDPIRLHELIGYEEQKKEVLRNTEQFVKGFKANNMLLYGDRGTGKSSTIKAMLHEFGKDGLRMVEVLKHQLVFLPEIISQLSKRPQRFIIFIDELSFEEYETEYKYLKAMLEGSLEATPDNVVIYATSNRRHLVREFHSDRGGDEIKAGDTVQEKLSLSDRFGITVVFMSPDQENYLKIVEGIARQRGLDIDPGELRKMAVKWELWHNQRSGRTARQFIEDLLGRMGAKNSKS
ncbi:ATP-binding protein [Thermoanaerobacterium sp. DL9XJH110]|uniref:ATP-binding protein n=1 Tax=Thermoanaerobacterium sp. DL9XJH110 TaxID=3386643 RepID=UPI003BB7AD96